MGAFFTLGGSFLILVPTALSFSSLLLLVPPSTSGRRITRTAEEEWECFKPNEDNSFRDFPLLVSPSPGSA